MNANAVYNSYRNKRIRNRKGKQNKCSSLYDISTIIGKECVQMKRNAAEWMTVWTYTYTMSSFV